jgi:hypothetical protein
MYGKYKFCGILFLLRTANTEYVDTYLDFTQPGYKEGIVYKTFDGRYARAELAARVEVTQINEDGNVEFLYKVHWIKPDIIEYMNSTMFYHTAKQQELCIVDDFDFLSRSK